MNPQELKKRNTNQMLIIVSNFGWARADFLGQMLWHDTPKKSAIRMGQRLASDLVKQKLLIERPLPNHGGRAYVLSTSGSRQLGAEGIKNNGTGKDWGTLEHGKWRPPGNWQHDLWVQFFIAWVFREKPFGDLETVLTEKQLRKSAKMQKIPDAILMVKSGEIYWVELERAKKSGAAQDFMIETALLVKKNKIEISNMIPSDTIFVVPTDFQDGYGHCINHRKNIEAALARKSENDMLPLFVEFEQHGASAVNFKIGERRTVSSDKVGKVLLQLTGFMKDWPAIIENGTEIWVMNQLNQYFNTHSSFGKISANIWRLSDNSCRLTVKSNIEKAPSTLVENEEVYNLARAQRRLAWILAAMQ